MLPDGTRLLGVHAAPNHDDGSGINESMSDDELHTLLASCEADLVVVGHTHRPLKRRVGGVHVINLGSVSIHVTSDKRASYAILSADEEGYRVTRRHVPYDRASVVAQVKRVRHPGGAFIAQFL